MPDPSTLDTIIAGSWYLPATPEHRVGGRLYVQSDERTVLEIAGPLGDPAGAWDDLSELEDLIHGIGTDGTLYSLFNCKLKSATFQIRPDDEFVSFADSVEYSHYVWQVSYYTDGHDFVDDTTDVSAIHVSFTVLREWMSVEESLESVWSERPESRIVIPQEREYVCDINGTSITLHYRFKASRTEYESSVEYEPYFEISEPSSTIRTVVSDWILPLQRLMMFLSSDYAHMTTIRIRCCDSERFVDLHLQTPHASIAKPTRFFDFYLHRATLDEMGVPLGGIIENWFHLESNFAYLGEVIDELSSRNHRYDEVVLLLLFRVVEFFHDNEIGGQRVPQDQHELRVEEIVSHIPAETDRIWVRGVLIEKNRKSLSTVLREVLESCGQVGTLVTDHHPDFVRRARKTRSKTAHTRNVDQESSKEVAAICVGLVWIVRRIITKMVLGSDQLADDYISSHDMFRRYLGESEDLA